MSAACWRDGIRVLRAFTPARDTLAVRRTLERAIGPASLRRHASSPHSIVCVRRLRMRSQGVAGTEWRGRMESRVEALVARAARPIAEPVPADAEAVVFRDEAELLACLSRDWARGAERAWWWRGLVGSNATRAVVHRHLAGAPELVPAVVALLDRHGAAREVLSALDAPVCEELSHAVRVAFALPASRDLVADGQVTRRGRTEMHLRARRRLRELDRVIDGVAGLESLLANDPARGELLALCMVVVRAPALARAEPLAPLLRQWREQRASRGAFSEGAGPTNPTRGARSSTPDRSAPGDLPAHETAATSARALPGCAPAEASASSAVQPHPGEIPARESATAPVVPRTGTTESQGPASETERADAGTQATTEATHASRYAGVFYLMNVALHMGLYADFANPLRPALAMPPGDLLAHLLELACGSAVRRDPVWGVLAALSGRNASRAPSRQLPGYVDLPGKGARARRRLVRVFRRWLLALSDTMRERLSLALGSVARDPLEWLCTRDGTLILNDSRLVVRFALAEHPLEIRLAGLDRDCGWVPAAGRGIGFEYE